MNPVTNRPATASAPDPPTAPPPRPSIAPPQDSASRPAGLGSPSSATDPDTSAMTSSTRPVTANPAALTATARLAWCRSSRSSTAAASGKLTAGSRTPLITCIPPTLPAPHQRRRCMGAAMVFQDRCSGEADDADGAGDEAVDGERNQRAGLEVVGEPPHGDVGRQS